MNRIVIIAIVSVSTLGGCIRASESPPCNYVMPSYREDNAQVHEENLQRALDRSIRLQEHPADSCPQSWVGRNPCK